MVRFCQKCGTRDPDDEALFCKRCGSGLAPRMPEKNEVPCPRCGTIIRDPQAVFCNRCGSPLQPAPKIPVVRRGAQPPAAPPATGERCPSCGAPRVDVTSEYCNVCGAGLHGPYPSGAAVHRDPYYPEPGGTAPLTPSRETHQQHPAGPGAVPPVTEIPDEGIDELLPERRIPLKWALAAGAVIVILLILGAFVTGMLPGTNRSANATPAAALPEKPAATTKATAPARTTAPVTTASPVPTTAVTANATAAPAAPAPATTAPSNATAAANATANATAAISLPVADASTPFAAGESAYDGKGNLTVNDFTFRDKMSDPIPSYAIGKKYLIVNITYQNLQKNGTVDAGLSKMLLKDGGGYPFEPASDAILENPWSGTSILPGEKRTGNLLFIVPPEATFLKLSYAFSDKDSAVFQLT